MNITIRRPIYDPRLCMPGLDVAINIPSIKTVLAEREYQFVTSMAGDNFSEALTVPKAAQWLQQYYSVPVEVPLAEAADGDEVQNAASPKQAMFKQALQSEKDKSQLPLPLKVSFSALHSALPQPIYCYSHNSAAHGHSFLVSKLVQSAAQLLDWIHMLVHRQIQSPQD